MKSTYPAAERLTLVENHFGYAIADPYRWLEEDEDPRTIAWLRAQEALANTSLRALPAHNRLRDIVLSLMSQPHVTSPTHRGNRAFVVRRDAHQEPVLLVRDGEGAERVLLNVSARDPSGRTTLDAWNPSPTGHLVACQLSRDGTEDSVLHVLDTETGRDVETPIPGTRYSPIAWLASGPAFYYVRAETEHHRGEVRLHRVGGRTADDIPVLKLERGGGCRLSVSHDGRWLLATVSAGASAANALWIAELAAGPPETPKFRIVRPGAARTFGCFARDDRLYLLTTHDAPRGRICVVHPADPDVHRWRELVPEASDTVLTQLAILDRPGPGESPAMVVTGIRRGASTLTIHNLDSGQRLAELQLPGAGTIDGLRTRPEGGHEAWFRYTDLVTPPTICRIDAGYCKPEIVSDSARPKLMDVRTERVEYISVDGTLVRLSLLTAAGSDHGPRPTILHAYGGFGVPTTPHYDPMMLAWIQAGGAVAVAAVRGGSEEGADWHRAGQRAYKQRSVEDFIAAAEWLIAKRRTTPQTLAALGGSNGGLLVAAALTQRPELFAAAVCCAPLTDMMRFGRFGRAAPWRHEYGDATQPEDVASLIAYSPYHRVRERVPYPAVLVAAFAGDTRVHPMHARKLCAALQYATSSEAPVLLREEAGVGHGQRSASRALHLAADILAFVADRTGLKDPVVVREVQDDEC